jgi:hypothetical protein
MAQRAAALAEGGAGPLTITMPLLQLGVAGERPRASVEVTFVGLVGDVGRRAVPGTAAQLAAVLVDVAAELTAGKLFVNQLVDGIDEAVQSALHRDPSRYAACFPMMPQTPSWGRRADLAPLDGSAGPLNPQLLTTFSRRCEGGATGDVEHSTSRRW